MSQSAQLASTEICALRANDSVIPTNDGDATSALRMETAPAESKGEICASPDVEGMKSTLREKRLKRPRTQEIDVGAGICRTTAKIQVYDFDEEEDDESPLIMLGLNRRDKRFLYSTMNLMWNHNNYRIPILNPSPMQALIAFGEVSDSVATQWINSISK